MSPANAPGALELPRCLLAGIDSDAGRALPSTNSPAITKMTISRRRRLDDLDEDDFDDMTRISTRTRTKKTNSTTRTISTKKRKTEEFDEEEDFEYDETWTTTISTNDALARRAHPAIEGSPTLGRPSLFPALFLPRGFRVAFG
jgi:hypothetical protein